MAASTDPPAGPVPALEMIDVAVAALRDPSSIVLEGVQWTVNSSEFWVVGGLHRSGKSDLIGVAAGLIPPAQGTVRWFGQDCSGEVPLPSRRRVGLVFDGGQLLHHLTLAENITLPLLYHLPAEEPPPEERIRALIEFTGLAPWIDKRPAEVSRNWQQRIGLARALALQPELLLLDNPLTGLDPRDAAWWLARLTELSAGHPLLDNRPLTLVVTADDFRPWTERARQFGVVHDHGFHALGGRTEVIHHADPVLDDLLRAGQLPGLPR